MAIPWKVSALAGSQVKITFEFFFSITLAWLLTLLPPFFNPLEGSSKVIFFATLDVRGRFLLSKSYRLSKKKNMAK